MAEGDDELDVVEEAGGDLGADHHVGDGGLQVNRLAGQLAEQLFAEQNVLRCNKYIMINKK